MSKRSLAPSVTEFKTNTVSNTLDATHFPRLPSFQCDLRDYFAASALTVLLSDQSMVWEAKNLANRAYEIADEMLRVRGCSNP